jgi:hypothetical protein
MTDTVTLTDRRVQIAQRIGTAPDRVKTMQLKLDVLKKNGVGYWRNRSNVSPGWITVQMVGFRFDSGKGC